MNKSNVYIFLDWFMTINELISDGKVNEKKFNVFSAAIKRLENASGLCAHLVVVSGTREESAKKVFSLLKPEFDGVGICFDGFAFEYGGYMIEGSGAIKRIYAEKTDLGQEIEKLKNLKTTLSLQMKNDTKYCVIAGITHMMLYKKAEISLGFYA